MMTESTPFLESTFIITQLLIEAVSSFNQQKWYEAHDQFEALWHQNSGQFREFLHGMIQVSVAEYHLENGNTNGSVLLMAEGLHHLEHCKDIEIGYDLDLLLELVRNRFLALQGHSDPANLPKPTLKTLKSGVNFSRLNQRLSP